MAADDLLVTVRRYRCGGCGHVWRQDTSWAAEPRAKLSRRALRWALEGIVCRHLTVARVAEALAVSWNTANDAVLAEGRRVLIADPDRFDGVAVVGVDEHAWRHTRKRRQVRHRDHRPHRGAGRDRPGAAAGHGRGPVETGLQELAGRRPQPFRDGIEVVAMDGFTGFKTATTEEVPDAVAVMDPFHVVR